MLVTALKLKWERNEAHRSVWYMAHLADWRKACLTREYRQWGRSGRRQRVTDYRITIYQADGTFRSLNSRFSLVAAKKDAVKALQEY